MGKKKSSAAGGASLAELQRHFVQALKSKRAELQQELDAMNRRIQLVEEAGSSSPVATTTAPRSEPTAPAAKRPAKKKKKGRGKRPRNQASLLEFALMILSDEKKALTHSQIAARALERGYKTNSENFENTVYQTLYNARRKGDTALIYDEDAKLWKVGK